METMTLPRNARDLTGQRFGRLVVERPVERTGKGILWLCRCDCGGTKTVLSAYLTKHKTTSCGCIRQEAQQRQNIAGQRFGRLVAIDFQYHDEKHQDYWRFQCDCGNEKIMSAASVKWNRVRSCGCLLREQSTHDITGQRFGRLVALESTQQRDNDGSVIWQCQCDCGNLVRYSVARLARGTTQSCGCLYKESRQSCGDHRTDAVEGTVLSALVSARVTRSDNASGCTGVSFDKKTQKWQAYINVQKKRHHLGFFSDREDAIKARKRAEETLHDPLIQKNWDSLTIESREKYLSSLKQPIEMK